MRSRRDMRFPLVRSFVRSLAGRGENQSLTFFSSFCSWYLSFLIFEVRSSWPSPFYSGRAAGLPPRPLIR